MKHENLLFGISPYRDDSSDVDSENDNVQVRGLCYTVDNPAVEEDKDNSHDERCHCEECMIDGCQRYRCFLCERDNMRLEAAEYHCSEDTHMGNLQELKREQEDAIRLVDRWNQVHKRLEGAGRFCLPDSLLAAIYRCLILGDTGVSLAAGGAAHDLMLDEEHGGSSGTNGGVIELNSLKPSFVSDVDAVESCLVDIAQHIKGVLDGEYPQSFDEWQRIVVVVDVVAA
jgi:hypothetical protein